MCKVLHESEKKELKTLTESLEKLTGKTMKLESKEDCNCCSTKNSKLKEANDDSMLTVKEVAMNKLADFFRVSVNSLENFKFDGTDNIQMLTKSLNSTSDSGTELYYKTAIKSAKRDLGLTENLTEGTWSIPKDKSDVQKVVNFIHTINRIKTEMYNVVGDDDLMDHLDGAIQRMQQLIPEELK